MRNCRSVLKLLVFLSVGFTAGGQDTVHALPDTVGPRNGWLFLEGGADYPDPPAAARLRELIGGDQANFLLVPTAVDEKQYAATPPGFVDKMMAKFGFLNYRVLHTRDRQVANSEGFLDSIRWAKVAWFTGGKPKNVADAYRGTRAQDEFRALLDRGGVIAGSSAGAMIIGSTFGIGRGIGDAPEAKLRYEEGFGFVKGVIVWPHLLERHYENVLTEAIADHPELLGLAVEAGSALIIHGDDLEVSGSHAAAVYDGRVHDGKSYYFIQPGAHFNLKTRQIVGGR